MKIKMQYCGYIKENIPFYIDGVDITKYDFKPIYRLVLGLFYFKVKYQKIKIVYIPFIDKNIIFGIKEKKGKVHIYTIDEKEVDKILGMYTQYRSFNDVEKSIYSCFHFLINEADFVITKTAFGNYVDENGKQWFYGPYDCYSIYNNYFCINITHLVQRGDINIYVTDKFIPDQVYVRKGKNYSKYAYDLPAFATLIKSEISKPKIVEKKD